MSKCTCRWSRTVVSPYGEVFPCVNMSMINCLVGDIKKQKLKDIWNGKRYVNFRRKLKEYKLLPICSKCCHINNRRKLE